MKIAKNIFAVLAVVLMMFFICSMSAQAQMTKEEFFEDLMEKVERNLPHNWSVQGYGYYPRSPGVVIVVMDWHRISKTGYLNPLLKKFEEADITDFYALEVIEVSKKHLNGRHGNEMWSYLGSSDLAVISTEKKSLKDKAPDLLAKIKTHLKNGTHVEKLSEMYYDFMKNTDDRSKYCVGVLQKNETWELGDVCTLVFGVGHMEEIEGAIGMINFLQQAEVSYVYLYDDMIYKTFLRVFTPIKERCLR